MDWLDWLREQLGHMAELHERVTTIGADWLDSLQQLDLLAELRELVAATGSVDANQLGALALSVLPLAWLLKYGWRIWNRSGRRGAGVFRASLWGIIALLAGTVRLFVIVLVALFGIVMFLGRLDGAGRSYGRW